MCFLVMPSVQFMLRCIIRIVDAFEVLMIWGLLKGHIPNRSSHCHCKCVDFCKGFLFWRFLGGSGWTEWRQVWFISISCDLKKKYTPRHKSLGQLWLPLLRPLLWWVSTKLFYLVLRYRPVGQFLFGRALRIWIFSGGFGNSSSLVHGSIAL